MKRKTASVVIIFLVLTSPFTLVSSLQPVMGNPKATTTSQLVFSENFDDGDINDWTVTATGTATFDVSTNTSVSPPFSVHMKSLENSKAVGISPPYTLDLTKDYNVSLYFLIPHTNNHWFEVFNNHQIYLLIDYGGDLKSYTGTSAQSIMTLGTNLWYFIEIRAHPSLNSYDVYVNSTFKKTSPMWIHGGLEDNFRIGDRADGSIDRGEAYWDDIYIYQHPRPQKDILIINDPRKHAYFGWYRAAQMNSTGWDLLNRTILWAASYMPPNETRIVFFNQSDDDAAEVYNWLTNSGYSAENIMLHPAGDAELLPSDYYNTTDLVIYWNTYGYNSTNIVNSTVPFITVSAMQTDEMDIGTGVTTMHTYNDTFYVVNNNYYPTYNYPLGPFLFESGMEFEATEAASSGRVLVKAEVESVGLQVEMSVTQDIAFFPDGSANMSFTINIPQSSLADMYREAFFTNVSSLEQGVEYDVPESKAVSDTVEVEEGVKDITLIGDINGEGKLDIEDIATIAKAFGAYLGSEQWDAELDIDWDGKIDIMDIATAARGFGKTRGNTGHLNVIGYYNGTAVNCTNVYLRGPEVSSELNMSASGHTWYNILPGNYTVYGTYNTTERNTMVTVKPEKTSYAQLDFGGTPPPPPQTELASVREQFHQGIAMDQLILLGFNTNVTDSKIVPWGTSNETRISLMTFSPQLAEPIDYPMWRINVGPLDGNATEIAAEFMYTKIQYIQLMLRSLPGDQVYLFNWQMGIELPPGAELLNDYELIGLNWTIDFGGGTFMQANVTSDLQRVTVNETMLVTEQDITASEEYLNVTFAQYKKFKIDYLLGGSLSQVTKGEGTGKPKEDWSKTWTWTISPGTYVKTWSYGPLRATVRASPTLTTQWYVGWKFSWWRLQWFKTWLKITPSIKVEASVTATRSYSKSWSHTFWTWSRRFSFWVGPVYVWTKLKLTVTGSITVSAYGSISISTWARAYAYFKGGVKWTRGSGWSTIREHGWGTQRYIGISGAASLSVTPKAKCRVVFLFYDVAGPFVEGIPYVPITINYYTYKSNTWSIKVKFKIRAGVTFAGWLKSIIGLSGYSRTLYDWTLASWSGTW